jgi:regulator of protease activity HflC (stomatin/prohibitin superfamily)|tara:strand:+ start:465 stop:1325 length:861 start_codon:yes stop_codon:yes gene_type:complete
MVKFVPQGHIYTKTRFGKFTGELSPGLNFLTPIIEKVDKRINVMESVLDIPTQTAITRDNAQVSVDGVVFYQILEADKAAYAVSELGRAMENLTMTNIRTVMGNMNLDELLSQREKINSQLLNVIDEATTPWGVKVTRVEIKDIDPPRDLVDAMARQMKAERDKRAEILNAEGKRQSEILEAEGQKQAQILNAEGEREAAFREAEARERLAEAEANATETVSRAIAAGEMSAINYFIAQDYIKALQTIGSADNQKIIMLPLEATNLLGSIAGIGEIAKEVFGKDET